MSVEQTSQLIQLILNSVLLVAVCTIVSLFVGSRCRTDADRLQQMNQEWLRLSRSLSEGDQNGDRLRLLQMQLRRLKQQYRINRSGLLFAHYALLLSVLSTFVLALRTLINWNELIIGSLGLFVLGLGLLLVSTLFILVDSQCFDRSRLDRSQNSKRLWLDRSALRYSQPTGRSVLVKSGRNSPDH